MCVFHLSNTVLGPLRNIIIPYEKKYMKCIIIIVMILTMMIVIEGDMDPSFQNEWSDDDRHSGTTDYRCGSTGSR